MGKEESTAKTKAEEIRKLWQRYNNKQWRKWDKREQQSYDYSLGDQLTEEQEKDLRESGMPTFVINQLSSKVRIMKYFATANSPRWTGVGADGSDIDIAHIHTVMSEYSFYQSNGKEQYGIIIDNSFRRSLGYWHWYIDKNADRGLGDILFKSEIPTSIYVDPQSHDLFFRDASAIIIKGDFTRSQLKQVLPEFKNQIETATSEFDYTVASQRDINTSISSQERDYSDAIDPDTASEDQRLGYYQVYKKVRVPYVHAFIKIPPTSEQMEKIRVIVKNDIDNLKKEIDVSFKEKIIQLNEAVLNGEIIRERMDLMIENIKRSNQQILIDRRNKLMTDLINEYSRIEEKDVPEKEYDEMIKNKDILQTIASSTRYNKPKIKKECSIGSDKFLYEETLNISEYPIIPLPFEHTGTPYPMSAVTPLKGKQEEINKAHQIMIHNANLGSNLRWLTKQGQVDEDYWEKYSSAPGAILNWTDVDGSGIPPKEVLPAQLNNAFFEIISMGKSDMEYDSLVNANQMGVISSQPETYRGMLANDEFATRQMKSWMNTVLEPFLEHVGKVYQEMAQNFYTYHKVFRITQPQEGNYEEKTAEINIPIYDDFGNVIARFNDYSSTRYDVRVVAGSTLPVNRQAEIEQYTRFVKEIGLPVTTLISKLDIKNKEKVIAEIGEIQRLSRQVKGMEEAIKDRDGTIETLERQLVQAGIKNKVGQVEGELRKDLEETKAALKIIVKEMNLIKETKKKEAKEKTKK